MKKQLHLAITAIFTAATLFTGSTSAQWAANGTHIYNTNTGKVAVGFGTTTPPGTLTVKGSGGVPAASWANSGLPLFTGFGEQTVGNADYILSLASTLANARPVFIGRRSKGTLAAPSTVANNDFLMSFLASGYDGSSFQNPAGIDFYVDGAPILGSVPARISFVTGSNSATRAERLVIKSNGNIGIGTSSPNALLQLANTVANRKIVLYDAANNDNQYYGFGINSNTLRYQVDALTANHVFFAAAGSAGSNELMRIQGNGNVGIGTSNPTAKLEINGQIKITGGIPPVAGSVLTSDATGLASWGPPSSGGSQWTTSGNDIYNGNSGNVGIGTTNPSRAKLEVNGVAGTNTSAIFGGDGAGISIQRNWPTIGFNQYRDIATGHGKAISNGYGMQLNMDPATGTCYMAMQDSVAANASFVNTPVKGISIFKNGFVHVGNNDISNAATLSISGGTGFPSHFNYGTLGHTYIRGGSKTYGGAGIYANRRPSKVYINDLQGEHYLTGAATAGGDVILVAGGGKVGIGIDNPDYKMLIYSGTPETNNNTQIFKLRGRNPIQVFSDEFNTDRGYIKGVTNRTQTSQFSREGIEIGTGGGDIYLTAAGYQPALMVNGTNNNVGIGTNNPGSQLSFSNTLGNKISLWSSGANNDFGIGLQSGKMQFYTAGQDQFAFGWGNSNNFTQTMTYYPGSAQLGINCLPQAGYQLAVSGKVKAKEVRVETGWADYVFAEDYKLRSLNEVEQFVKTNKHLPEVTPGNEIEINGLEIGKVSAQMIKKIEELTLYVIDLQKQIDALKKASK